jgi:hypothetical protein
MQSPPPYTTTFFAANAHFPVLEGAALSHKHHSTIAVVSLAMLNGENNNCSLLFQQSQTISSN